MAKFHPEFKKILLTSVESEADFGKKAEQMLEAFLPKYMPGVERAERASRHCDLHCGLDVIAYLQNGQRIGFDFTITDKPEERELKSSSIWEQPIALLHDDSGIQTSSEKIPRVILYAPKTDWGTAWNEAGGDPYAAVSALRDPEGLGLVLSEKACVVLDLLQKSGALQKGEASILRSASKFLRRSAAVKKREFVEAA